MYNSAVQLENHRERSLTFPISAVHTQESLSFFFEKKKKKKFLYFLKHYFWVSILLF